MSYKLTYEVQIGDYLLRKELAAAEIRSTWKELTDTATITLPRNMYLKRGGQVVELRKERLSDTIRRGMPVEIKLGYNGENEREFVGYVAETDATIPFVVRCEDEMFNLKRKPLTFSYQTVSLKTLLKRIAPGYKIDCPDTEFASYQAVNASPARVLEDLKNFNLYAWFDLDKTLHVGFPYANKYNRHVYNFQKNVRENNLRFRRAEDIKLRVKAIANRKTGKKETYEFGDLDGEIRSLNFGDITSAQLREYAHAEIKRFKFDGYQGDVTGWGLPRTRHGDVLRLIDDRYEHNGDNIIDSVAIRFDDNGWRRTNELGPKAL